MTRNFFYLFLFIITSCGAAKRTEEAVSMNNMIVQKQDSLYVYLDSLIELISLDADPVEVKIFYQSVLSFAQKVLKDVESLPPLDEEDDFRQQSVEFFSVHVNILLDEFAQLMDLYALPFTEVTPEHENKWDSLLFRVADIDSVAIEHFLEEQYKFAKKYNFILKDFE